LIDNDPIREARLPILDQVTIQKSIHDDIVATRTSTKNRYVLSDVQ